MTGKAQDTSGEAEISIQWYTLTHTSNENVQTQI